MMLPSTMPGASRLTMSQRTAPRWWCARTLDREVKMMVAIEVAMAIFTARSAETPRWARMIGDEGHHQHAAANAQQAGQKTGAHAEHGQFNDQQGFENHGRQR